MDINVTIEAFFQEKLPNITLTKTDDIFKQGLVDSLFALQIVAFIEDTFAIECEDDDLELTNFSSINNLAQFVTRKLSITSH
ncbi:MAG: acyl carrier protein [Pseudomonadales bacterium]|nr:acyl carrier protein [Pseudomonadales bacterium]